MKELGNDNLEQIKQKGQKAWNQVLGKIEVEGGNLDQYRTFYSCLYRSLLFPRKFHELDEAGKPVHYSPYNGQVLPGYMFTHHRHNGELSVIVYPWASWFGHKGEEATPYYYKVYLAEYDIVTEMSPTERAVLFRFTFPENAHSYIAVDAFDKGSFIQIIPEENKIIGYSTRNSGGVPENFKNYFIIQFDKPFTYKATVNNGNIQENATEQTTDHAGAIIGFKTQRGEQHVRSETSP